MPEQRNRLEPHGWKRIGNFLLNFVWAIIWLGRWTIRLARRITR